MKRTIFNTPLITPAFRYLFKAALQILGWRVVGQLPDYPKFVVVGAPHTSNWDFVMFLALAFVLKGNLRYMGKKELFRWPVAGFFRWCGGVPVDRSKPQGLVEQTVQAIQASDHFQLVITPEGTRKKVGQWKQGFYHIAKKACIPIVAGYVDSRTKTCGIGPTFTLSDDMEADIKSMQAFFKDKVGINPGLTSEL
ncbi:MAG: lysophospholipid acyltransferase family protein [Anaerolineales bacterium]|nr:lysophospholipid acyltransferase family protein [Anaerolineales bacterium]